MLVLPCSSVGESERNSLSKAVKERVFFWLVSEDKKEHVHQVELVFLTLTKAGLQWGLWAEYSFHQPELPRLHSCLEKLPTDILCKKSQRQCFPPDAWFAQNPSRLKAIFLRPLVQPAPLLSLLPSHPSVAPSVWVWFSCDGVTGCDFYCVCGHHINQAWPSGSANIVFAPFHSFLASEALISTVWWLDSILHIRFLERKSLQSCWNVKGRTVQARIFSNVENWWNLREYLVMALNLEFQGYFQKINGMLLSHLWVHRWHLKALQNIAEFSP